MIPNRRDKETVKDFFRYWKIAYVILSLIFIAIVGVLFNVTPCLKQIIRHVNDATTEVIALANILLICITAGSLYYVRKTNSRAVSLFVSQIRPLIDVTPVTISQNPDGKQAVTAFSIVNYSGFKAFNIGIDLKYGDNDWILEWRKAKNEEAGKETAEGVVLGHHYFSRPRVGLPKLEPGQTRERDEQGDVIGISGSLKLEDEVCNQRDKGIMVLVRTTWENVNGNVFDAVHKYRLICTKVGKGRSFSFIPEGIVSQKD